MSERTVSAVRVTLKHSCRITRADGQPASFAAGESYYVSPVDFEQLKKTTARIPQYSADGTKRLDDKEEPVVEKADEIREPAPEEVRAPGAKATTPAATPAEAPTRT